MNKKTLYNYYSALKFCPVCGKELEISAISGLKACFVHGDFDTEFDRVNATWRIVLDVGQ